MKKTVHVTDHAVLRYLERAHGLDVDAVRQHIAGRALSGVELGAAAVVIDRVKFVLKGSVVITVYKRRWPTYLPDIKEEKNGTI